MNQLENILLSGAVNAHRRYRWISDGWWLWHAPETFIMSWVATYVQSRFESIVYMDCTTKKLAKNMGRAKRGRPESKRVRYDLVIWKKASKYPRAIVEIKKNANEGSLRSDLDKLRKYRPKHRRRGRPRLNVRRPVAAYLLAYSETGDGDHRGRLNVLAQRGKDLERVLHCKLVGLSSSERNRDDEENDWAIYLFRLRRVRSLRRRPRRNKR